MKFWYSLVPGGFGAVGRVNSEITSSVFGSNIRATGGETEDGQTLSSRPWVSNEIEPHSEGGVAPEVACRSLPSGPERW